jgi:hypothetical protein
MAIFASTTTSGYSDPMKAFQIKALEQRQKDMMAQQATSEAGMFTPQNTQTPVQGLAQVANVAVDAVKQHRADQATAEGRNELAQTMTGYDANKGLTPEQKGVLARRSPELLDKLLQHEQERAQTATTEGGLNTRNTATITGQNQRSDAEIAGRRDVANIQESGATGRTISTLANKSSEGALDRTASSEQLESKQEHETKMARLNAELAGAQKEKDYAQQNNLADRSAVADQNITRLKADLAAQENRQGERFQASQLNQKLAQDEKLQGLQREAVRANLEYQTAATTRDKVAQQKAEQDLLRIGADINTQRDLIKQGHEAQMQSTKIASDEKLAANELAMKKTALDQKRLDDAADPATLQKKADAEKKLASETSLVDELTKAKEAFGKGIFTGPEAGFEAGKANLPFVGSYLGDREKAARTTQVNNAMEKVAAGAMSTMLKGATTDFELKKFINLWNDPKVPYQAKVDQFDRVITNLQADRASQAEAVKKMGGTDRSAAAAGTPPTATADPLEGRTATGPDGTMIRRNGKWEKQ